MKEIGNGIQAFEKEDVEKCIKKSKAKNIFVFDEEFNRHDYITDVYEDGEGDLIIVIGGDA